MIAFFALFENTPRGDRKKVTEKQGLGDENTRPATGYIWTAYKTARSKVQVRLCTYSALP
jgi:hypothetical protein